ncbi:MAG: MerR family transcriptional regulator, heat shock protein HspR [Frankiaceae bacterium]|nr:MerR family transcriptional regulator, heat shock protein HspR [Frankiaceae bacterium]
MPTAAFPDDSRPLYTVGQVAELVGVQQAFLRRLDQYDVVSPARSDGAQRRYSRNDIGRVEAALDLIGEGITLAGVRRVFELQAEVNALKAELARERARRR